MEFKLENSTKIILKVVGIILALLFLWLIRDIVVMLLLAIVVASAMEPMVDYLNKRRIPRAVSVLGVYVLVIGFAALILSLITPLVVAQFQLLVENLPQYSLELQARYPNLATFLGGSDLTVVLQQLFLQNADGTGLYSRTIGIFNGVFAFVTILVISFYLVAADRGMKKFISELVPTKHSIFVANLIEKIQHKMGLWVLGQLILSIFIFILTYIGLTILGVEYALFLALVAGLFEVIPYVGPFLAAIPAVFFTLIQSPPLVIAVVVLYVVIQKTEGYILVPKIMQKTVGTSPLVVLLSLLIGFKLAGVLGLLLAVPLAGAVTVVIHEFFKDKDVQVDAQPDI